MTKSDNDWLKFLNPDSLFANFITASLFLTGYELLKESIVENLKSFYINGYKNNKTTYSDRYILNVLELDPKKRKFQSSIKWLQNRKIINDNEVKIIEEITIHRNEVAHELFKYLSDSEKEINTKYLFEIKRLIAKIDKWWIIEVELPTEPDMTEEKWNTVDLDKIMSMRMIEYDYLIEIVLNPDLDKYEVYNKIKERLENQELETSP